MSPKLGINHNNVISVFLMGALPAIAGSAISVLLSAFFVWAILSLVMQRIQFRMTPVDKRMAWTFAAFPILVFLTAIVAKNPEAGMHKALLLVPFLSLWVMIPRLRAGQENYLVPYICGAACGAIAAVIFAAVQWAIPMRPEGLAGNPAVFAIMTLALAAIASLNILSDNRWHRWLAWLGFASGLCASIVTLVRGVWMATVGIAAVVACYAPRAFRKSEVVTAGILILGSFILLWLLVPSSSGFAMNAAARVFSLTRMLFNLDSETGVRSVDLRIDMWSGAWRAFLDSPWIGYGIQNGMDALRAHLPAKVAEEIIFTHAHNGFLTFALDGGIVLLGSVIAMLAMPVVIAWRAPRDETHRKRLFLALLVSGVYALCGMTQIMFRHDIMDSFFIFNTIVVAASVPSRTVTKAETENLTRLDIRQEDD